MLDADQPWNRPPDPIPASYYARPPAVAETPDRRRWRWIVLAAGGAVCLVWIVQTPWRPALGLFGLLLLGTVVLVTDPLHLRGRIPLLRSHEPGRAIAGWSVIGLLLLVAAFVALAGPSGSSTAHRQSAALRASPPSGTLAETLPTPSDAGTPEPSPTTTPTPTPSPSPSASVRPSPSGTPTPVVTVAFVGDPYTGTPGGNVTVRAQTAPNTSCTLTTTYPKGPGSLVAVSSASGAVSWSWRVNPTASTGTSTLTVRCDGAADTTTLTLR